jgi:hypothetical protein
MDGERLIVKCGTFPQYPRKHGLFRGIGTIQNDSKRIPRTV